MPVGFPAQIHGGKQAVWEAVTQVTVHKKLFFLSRVHRSVTGGTNLMWPPCHAGGHVCAIPEMHALHAPHQLTSAPIRSGCTHLTGRRRRHTLLAMRSRRWGTAVRVCCCRPVCHCCCGCTSP